jgi:hypothetical protein
VSNSEIYEGFVARLIRGDKECQVLVDSQYDEPISFKIAADFSVMPILNIGDSVEVEFKEDGKEIVVVSIKITAVADEECDEEEGEAVSEETDFWIEHGGKVAGYSFCACGLLAAYFMPEWRELILFGTGIIAFYVTILG